MFNEILVYRAGTHKMLVRIPNSKTLIRLLLQKQSDLGLRCLTKPLGQATSVQSFRAFTVCFNLKLLLIIKLNII